MRWPLIRWLVGAMALIAWRGGLPVAAQAPLPQSRLTWIYPPALRTGSTQEVTIAGSNLESPVGLQFSDPRIRAELKPGSGTVFRVMASAEVPIGLYDVRFVGRWGASNPRGLWIGRLTELVAPASHANPTTAMELPLGAGVSDRVSANTASWFKSSAPEGTRLLVRILSAGLDSRVDPIVTILDGGQHEMARTARGVLAFQAPSGGVFWIRVNDSTFRGGEEFAYHLELSVGPQVDFVLPAAVPAGTNGLVSIFGRNLPGGVPSPLTGRDDQPLQRLDLVLDLTGTNQSPSAGLPDSRPSSLSLASELIEWRLFASNGVSNPILLSRPGREPALAVSASNSWAPIVTRVQPPAEVHGLFPRRGELAGMSFDARAGQVFWMDLSGERNGFPVDPMAVLQRLTRDSNGVESWADVQEFSDSDTQFGGTEFNTTSRDPSGRIQIPSDGTYRLLVRDLFHTAARSPRLPYRLVLRLESPGFQLVAFPFPPLKTKGDDRSVFAAATVLRRGEVVPVKVIAYRRDGFAGDITLSASGLPPGVTALPSRILSGQNSGLLFLTASTNAHGVSQVQITGTSTVGTGAVTRTAATASVVWDIPDTNNDSPSTRATHGLVVSVCSEEQAPIEMAVSSTLPLRGTNGGVIQVPLRITRRGDFQGAFTLKAAGRPEWDKVKEVSIAEKATQATVELRLADLKVPVGSHGLWFQGVVSGKYRNQPEAVAAAEQALKAANEALLVAKPADKAAAERRKKDAEAAKKSAEERAAPRDAAVSVFSAPILIQIDPSAP